MPPDRFTLRGNLISVNRGSAELVLVRLQHLEIRVAHDPSVALLGAQENRRRPGHPINPVLHWVTRLVRWRMPRALVGDQVRRVEAVPQRRGQSDLAAVNNWRRSLSPELQSGVISYTEPRKGNRSTVCRRRSWIATHRTTLRREYEGAGEVRCRALPRRVTSPDPTWASPRIGSISFDFKFPQLLPCTSHDAPRSGASPHPSSVRTSTMSR